MLFRGINKYFCLIRLSGLENMALRLYEDTGDKRLVCAFILDYLGRALCEITDEILVAANLSVEWAFE